jgi:hypothetical protein
LRVAWRKREVGRRRLWGVEEGARRGGARGRRVLWKRESSKWQDWLRVVAGRGVKRDTRGRRVLGKHRVEADRLACSNGRANTGGREEWTRVGMDGGAGRGAEGRAASRKGMD